MKLITETDRLYLRELTVEDAIHFFQLNDNPEVLKYTGDKPFESVTEAHDFLESYINQYQQFKMGRWAVCLKKDNLFVGWCGLKYHVDDDIVDVGYRFYKNYWNKGFATEACKASIKYGFEELDLKVIYAHVHINNIASHRVAIKSGLAFVRDFTYDDQPAKLYKIHQKDYLNALNFKL